MKLAKDITIEFNDYRFYITKSSFFAGDCIDVCNNKVSASFYPRFVIVNNAKAVYHTRDITNEISKVAEDDGWIFEDTFNIPKKLLNWMIDILKYYEYLVLQITECFKSDLPVSEPKKLSRNADLLYRGYNISIIKDYHIYECIQFTAENINAIFKYKMLYFNRIIYDTIDITSRISGASLTWKFEDTIDLTNVIDQMADMLDYCKDLNQSMIKYINRGSNTKSANLA